MCPVSVVPKGRLGARSLTDFNLKKWGVDCTFGKSCGGLIVCFFLGLDGSFDTGKCALIRKSHVGIKIWLIHMMYV